MSITANDLERMLRAAGARTTNLFLPASKVADLFNVAMIKYGDGLFNTTARVAALVSECMMESDYFRTSEEYTKTGPYRPYIGRSAIQVTWRDNYARFGTWCKAKKLITDADYFVKNPQRLADQQWYALGGVWYFTHTIYNGKPMIEYANDIRLVGRLVNNGPGGVGYPARDEARRIAAYNAVMSVGAGIVPDTIRNPPETITTTEPVHPTAGEIHTPFGAWGSSWSWNRRTNGTGQHGGDDWHRGAGAAEIGDKIVAVADGTVIYAGSGGGWGPAFGRHVLIKWDHHGRTSIDAHMSKITAKTGQRVTVGDKIGEKGMSGNVSGPHDHHEQHLGTLWGSPRVKPIYPGRVIIRTQEREHLDMAKQEPIKTRTQTITVPRTKSKPQLLRLDNKGNVSWGFGGGRYELDLNVRFSGASANDELVFRVVYVDTDKNGKQVGKVKTYPWVGLAGSSGKTFRAFTWRRHVPAPKSGRTRRRLRIEVANWSKRTIKIEHMTAVVWKAPL